MKDQPAMLTSGAGDGLISNAAWSLLNQTVRTGAMAVWMLALTRCLPPEQFGTLIFGLSFARIFSVLASLGLDRVATRFFLLHPQDERALLRRVFLLKLLAGTMAYVVMIGAMLLCVPKDSPALAIGAVAGIGLFFQAFDAWEFLYQAQGRMRQVFAGRSVALLLAGGLKITALWFSLPILWLAGLDALETALMALGLLIAGAGGRRNASIEPSEVRLLPSWRDLVRESLPLLLSALAVIIYMRVDVLMLGRMAGKMETGLYSAAAQISELWAFVPVALAPVIFPRIVRWHAQGGKSYLRNYQMVLQAALLMAVGIALLLGFFSSQVIGLIYGAAYPLTVPAAKVLAVHVWSGLFIFVGVAQSGFDIVERLTWLTTLRTVAGMVINIALNLIWIPRYGALGAAWATVIAYGCSAFLLNVIHPRTFRVFKMQLAALILLPLWWRNRTEAIA